MEKFRERKREALEHIKFCVSLYRLQQAEGRYFLHEHPAGATSWDIQAMSDLQKLDGVQRVECDQCQFGLVAAVNGEQRPARKLTGILTNCHCIAEELAKRCPRTHDHFSFIEGRAAIAQKYPPGLCKSICRGLQRQQQLDRTGFGYIMNLSSSELEKALSRARYPLHWLIDNTMNRWTTRS